MSFRVALDIDDVVLDYAGAFLRHFNQETGLRYRRSDLTSFYGEASIRVPMGFGRTVSDFFRDFPKTGLYKDMHFLPGAKEGLEELLGEYDVSFITARSSPEGQQAVYDKWHKQKLPMEKIYFTQQKGKLCRQLGIDILVDDAQHNLNSVYKDSPSTWPVVYSQPWNVCWGGRRVHNWPLLTASMPEMWYEKNGVIVKDWRGKK